MGLIRIQNVTKQYGGRVVLDDVSLELDTGRIVGVVGPNGAGKTTLFKLITGEVLPDMGEVTRSKGLEVGHLEQQPHLEPTRTLHDEVLSGFADLLALEDRMHALSDQMSATHDPDALKELMAAYDRVNAEFVTAGGYEMERRLAEVVDGLGFSEADRQLTLGVLSGGQKCRAALARLLLHDEQYLLLDEPTNHLDIDACRWLEKFLAGHKGGAAIISHDRYLLDRVADGIVEVDRAKVNFYPGNYSNYMQVKELRRLTQDRQFEKDREFIEKEKAFIAKHLAGQRSQEAKGRRTRLERRLSRGEFVLDRASENRTMRLALTAAETNMHTVLKAENLSKAYDGRKLFSGVSLAVRAGERIGITGPNGTGKSTLLKILLGLLPPDDGTVDLSRKALVGYYAQESHELDPSKTIMAEIQSVRPDLSEQMVRAKLGTFLFSGDDAFKQIEMLSGGEKSRVRLLKLMLKSPNVLVLDEPTNHLDIPSREVLEEALNEYEGTILVVSHDRYFLDRVVEELIVLRDGTYRRFSGNYSTYLEAYEREQEAQRAAEAQRTAAASRGVVRPTPAGTSQAAKPSGKRGGPRSAYQRMTLEELEAFIMQKETQIRELTERFADPAVCRDRARLAALDAEMNAAKAALAEAEAAWGEKVDGGS